MTAGTYTLNNYIYYRRLTDPQATTGLKKIILLFSIMITFYNRSSREHE